MRRLLGVDIRRVYEHATFMTNRRFLSYSIAIIAASIFSVIFLLLLGVGQTSSMWLSAPLIFSTIIYKILIAFQASRVGRELNTGEVQIYLAHTVTRTEYLLSTLLVVGVMPTLILLLTYTVMVAIVAPNMLISYDVGSQLLYLSADFMMFTALVMTLASRGRETAATVIGSMLALLIWIAIPMLLSFLIYYGSNKPWLYIVYTLTLLVSIATPFTYRYYYNIYPTMFYPPTGASLYPPSPRLVILISIVALIAILVLTFTKFKSRDL
jgi:ABC-type transport system involved in multi-copper enzyme maturation permease subunit